ncbi:MAG: hypothetical protein GF370_01470 [Candidatus Nealsonbacteria bacterium]|nr:hypothetical protein [Candidatus Nealsonbacteria bacterium]
MDQKKRKEYVMGVDGGGTDTTVALAELDGLIVETTQEKLSVNPRNVGVEMTVDNLSEIISQTLKSNKDVFVASTFIGLPAVAEEFQSKIKKIKKGIEKKVPRIFEGKVVIGSDQEVAFRSGTDEKDGVLIIAGTGAVARGWKGDKQSHCSGWGWLADEGSAFFTGQKTFQAILKSFDGRGPRTALTELVGKELGVRSAEDLADFVYNQPPTDIIPLLSIVCDKAESKGDVIAKQILTGSAQELALAGKTVIKELGLGKSGFPLVLVGGMFKSKIVLEIVKREIKKEAHRVEFIRPIGDPVKGAVKRALENLS